RRRLARGRADRAAAARRRRRRTAAVVADPGPAHPGGPTGGADRAALPALPRRLAPGRGRPGPPAPGGRRPARGAVGGRAMPARGLRGRGAGLADGLARAAGRRPRPAPVAGGGRQRPRAGLRVPRGARGGQPLAGGAAPGDRGHAATPARAQVPRRHAAGAQLRPAWLTAMLWACIHLPQLALDGVLRRHPAPEAPLALVTGPAQKRVLAAVNPAAARAGLRAGQALAAAHALLADFATVEHDPAEVARWRDFLAAWAYRYSSQVSTSALQGTPDDAIVLE